MTYRVLATPRSFCQTEGAHHTYLRDNDCEVDCRPPQNPYAAAALGALIAGYDGAILGLDHCDASVIEKADRLRVISRYGAGVDKVDLEAASRRGIAVTSAPGANSNGVAELAIALMFALARDIPHVAASARSGVWQRAQGWELSGKTLGIVGFGSIGRSVAQMARGIGMRVLAYDPLWQGEMTTAERVDLDTLLREAHVVSLHAPNTPETRNLINAGTIAKMRDGAYVVNTARGELVDEAALCAALQTGKLAGAAADVFVHDPPAESPLLKLDNFIGTPHIGATTRESVARTAMMAAQNLVAVLRGEPCQYVVNATMLKQRDS